MSNSLGNLWYKILGRMTHKTTLTTNMICNDFVEKKGIMIKIWNLLSRSAWILKGVMSMNLLNDVGFKRLEGAMGAATLRQQVISNNIANADTPYFKRSDVSFENMLKSQMDDSQMPFSGKVEDKRHFQLGNTNSIPQAMVTSNESTVMNNNLNNVDMDVEMSNLAENQLRYNAYIEQINHQIKMMRTAIQGGS